jgi:hypothetical protein
VVVHDQSLFLVVVNAALEIRENGIICEFEEGKGWVVWLKCLVGGQERGAEVFVETEKGSGVTRSVPNGQRAGVCSLSVAAASLACIPRWNVVTNGLNQEEVYYY